MVDQKSIKLLQVLKGFQKNICVPDRVETISKSVNTCFMQVDHFGKLFSLASTSDGSERVELDQSRVVASREILYLILGLNCRRGVRQKGHFCKSARRSR